MEKELRDAPPSYRNTMNTKLRMHRRDLAKLQRDMKSSASGFSNIAAEGSNHGIYSAQNQQSVSVPLKWSPVWVSGLIRLNKPFSVHQ